MPLSVNLRHLEEHNVRLTGELSVEELDIDSRDDVIAVTHPLFYDVEAQKVECGLLLSGKLELVLDCQCVRCLKSFHDRVSLGPNWRLHLSFTGDEAVAVCNDCVDLTPYIREDILLEFPQHPLCDPECGGLPDGSTGRPGKTSSPAQNEQNSSAWAELNKLKF